jgi:hypothetical protein
MSEASFEYVPFGGTTHEDAISCDGLVDGAGLHASHWAGNRTPRALKADTSVEIALTCAARGVPRGALVTNNHFDADGVLAVFALIEPERAAKHSDLITAAAEVGDFGEWPDDERGLRLEMAISALAAGTADDRDAYARVLPALAALVEDVDARRDLWGEEWNLLLAADRRAREGALEVELRGNIAVLVHRPGVAELPGPVLFRRSPPGATRWLLAFEQEDGQFQYRYERRRWAWADTVRRPRLAAPSRNAIAQDLGPGWDIKSDLGMTGILRTIEPIAPPPGDVVDTLLRRDPGAR